MSKDMEIKSLANSGMGAAAIASRLGITRARVYQIAKRAGVSFPRQTSLRVPVKPRARVMTGGVSAPINASVAGTIAELLVAADLMARGWQVFMPLIASKGHDLIAAKADRLITVEVRSAYRNSAGRLIYARKPDCSSSHYAAVITGEPVHYDPDI